MQIRKFFKGVYYAIKVGSFALLMMFSVRAMDGLHYGVRSDILQPVHALGHWLWYSNFHVQVPSFEKSPQFWLANLSTGMRGALTPYFIFGTYISGGQLQNRLGRSYLINPGIECWFPWAKLGIHGYFIYPQITSENVRPIEQSALVKRALDIKLSGTFLPFVRPFLATYYLSKFGHAQASHSEGSLHFSWGIEWLMAPHCSFEAQHDISRSSVSLRVKLHSAKIYQPTRKARVIHYMKEPIDQYILPIMLLSPDGSDQEMFWSFASSSPSVDSSFASIRQDLKMENNDNTPNTTPLSQQDTVQQPSLMRTGGNSKSSNSEFRKKEEQERLHGNNEKFIPYRPDPSPSPPSASSQSETIHELLGSTPAFVWKPRTEPASSDPTHQPTRSKSLQDTKPILPATQRRTTSDVSRSNNTELVSTKAPLRKPNVAGGLQKSVPPVNPSLPLAKGVSRPRDRENTYPLQRASQARIPGRTGALQKASTQPVKTSGQQEKKVRPNSLLSPQERHSVAPQEDALPRHPEPSDL